MPPMSLEEVRPELPPAIIGICHRMLHKNVTERYRTMADVAADLAKFLRNDKDIPAATPLNLSPTAYKRFDAE